ncbi:hypothetical protein RhiirA4_462577 [Rhizophagus irregularis]|uniref:Uncharacterized protein n=1 Tax=Rhizophagus irregularis TaxID=588596 RepID=A0A2I1GL84_9GLOM|nr:hypothetical protein RhiirA4_462577 [Rhizophagus irregularis]
MLVIFYAFSPQSVVKRNTFKNYNQERNKQQIHQLRTELAQPLLSGSPDKREISTVFTKEDLPFRARPAPNVLPYRPKKSDKPITKAVEFNLHTDARLEKRKLYDEQRKLLEQEEKILKERRGGTEYLEGCATIGFLTRTDLISLESTGLIAPYHY